MIFKVMRSLIKNLLRLALPDDYNLRVAQKCGLKIGSDCRFYSYNFGSEPYLIEIGNHVTISSNVNFVTHDGGVWVFREYEPEIEVTSPIKLGDNVFVGHGSVILPGTIVGDNVVIGAGSIVKGNISSNSVYAGVPAKKISTIEEYRKKLKNVEFVKNRSKESKRNFYLEKFRS